nr:DUF4179 domain-containing protein [Clostridium sp. D46t1_190503_E9]
MAFEFNRKLIAALIIISIFSVLTINPKVLASISSFFKDKGVQKAANNGYIQTLPENAVKDNGITMNIDNVVADKTKIGISFTLKFDDISEIKDVNDIQLGLNVKDNNDRVIFEHLKEGIYTPIQVGQEWSTDISNKDNGELKYYLKMYSTEGQLYDINSLSIKIDSIKLYEENVRYHKGIEGEWNFSLDLNDVFKEMESIKYVAKNNSDIVSLNSIEVMPTGTIINANINRKVDENIVNKIIITDESGEKVYKFTDGNIEDTKYGVKISFMYDLTTFDNLDNIKMIVKDIEGKDIVLDLEKENN